MYGFTGDQLPVYFKNDVVLAAGGAAGFRFGRGGGPWQNTTPMATRPELSPYELPAESTASNRDEPPQAEAAAAFGQRARQAGVGDTDSAAPRVIMSFPDQADQMLLSGGLGGGEALQGRAQVIDAPLGDGHVVMFGIRPFWRWQTQGNYFLGFNTILNWNDLDARPAAVTATDEGGVGSR